MESTIFHKTSTLFIIYIMCMPFLVRGQEKQSSTDTNTWHAGNIISELQVAKQGLDAYFTQEVIDNKTLERMKGKSYKSNCTIKISELRLLKLLHRNKDGQPQMGEIVCNKSIAYDLIDIFKTLYIQDYRIERMVLVDDYDADDEKSMCANNTSCFNFRAVNGSKTLSKHSRGLAIDINPLYNPCVNFKTGKVEPSTGKRYAYSRTKSSENISFISTTDPCYKLFIKHGFTWGGNWKSKKDYQHFEKNM